MGWDLILASSSPRRRDLLLQMGIAFTVYSADTDEFYDGPPRETVSVIAKRKADAALNVFPDKIILSADTLVYAQGKVLGKPRDLQDAYAMLKLLSGGWHEVYTGVCMINTLSGCIQEAQVVTRVRFVSLSDQAIAHYAATGEPMDKAGAYGIQGRGGMFISEIEGSYSNVIGLPMATVRDFLLRLGWQI
jgi:septum formation protein